MSEPNPGAAAEPADATRAPTMWKPITKSTPRGTRLQLINRGAGVPVYGSVALHEDFFTHYCEIPTFEEP
jgi:hypothetical protein